MNEVPTTLEGDQPPPPIPPDEVNRDGLPGRYLRSAYTGKPEDVLQKLALTKMIAYRVDALDAIYDLATMKVSPNSAQNQVKLAAAKLLAGIDEQPKAPEEGGLEGMLRTLNDQYHKDAPRIRSVRNTVVTFENEPRAIEQAP